MGWRCIFYVNAPIGIAALVAVTRILPQDRRTAASSLDVQGMVLLTLSVAALVLVAVWGGTTFAWGLPVIVGLFVLGALLLATCLRRARRHENPAIPLRMFRNRVVPGTAAISFMVGLVMFCASSYLPLFGRMTEEGDATQSALSSSR